MTEAHRLDLDEEALQTIGEEMARQFDLWGEQNHPALTDENLFEHWAKAADIWKRINARRVAHNTLAWDGIALEEVFESLGEPDPEKRIVELIQTAAVFATWALCEQRRLSDPSGTVPTTTKQIGTTHP
jgi:hypothetical protein